MSLVSLPKCVSSWFTKMHSILPVAFTPIQFIDSFLLPTICFYPIKIYQFVLDLKIALWKHFAPVPIVSIDHSIFLLQECRTYFFIFLGTMDLYIWLLVFCGSLLLSCWQVRVGMGWGFKVPGNGKLRDTMGSSGTQRRCSSKPPSNLCLVSPRGDHILNNECKDWKKFMNT